MLMAANRGNHGYARAGNSLGQRPSLNYLNERDLGGRPGRIEGAFVDIAVRL
jgi:hypothetical protein